MTDDITLRGLTQLTLLMPDSARERQVVEKCRARMVRHHQPGSRSRRLEYAIVGGFSAIYLLMVVHVALRAHGLL